MRAFAWTPVNDSEKNRLVELINNPPTGSKLAAAKEYRVDLTLLVESLSRAPTERLRKEQDTARFFEGLRRAGKQLDFGKLPDES